LASNRENTTALSENYWINNTGNVKLRVTASSSILNGIASFTWDPDTQYIDIPVRNKGNMTVTINPTTATGTCQVSFTCAKAS
jgi:glycogen synthase